MHAEIDIPAAVDTVLEDSIGAEAVRVGARVQLFGDHGIGADKAVAVTAVEQHFGIAFADGALDILNTRAQFYAQVEAALAPAFQHPVTASVRNNPRAMPGMPRGF